MSCQPLLLALQILSSYIIVKVLVLLSETTSDLQVPIKHKYGAIVTCKIAVRFSGAEDLRLLSCTFTFSGKNAKMGLLAAGLCGPCCQEAHALAF